MNTFYLKLHKYVKTDKKSWMKDSVRDGKVIAHKEESVCKGWK